MADSKPELPAPKDADPVVEKHRRMQIRTRYHANRLQEVLADD